jgi:energy-coupling factor transport system substrate-specific component
MKPVVGLSARSAIVLAIASVAGLAMFTWPLFVSVSPSGVGHTGDAPFFFVATMPVLVLVILAELADGGLDSKALAMLGILAAINAALRPLGAGTAGIETVFFLLVLAGRVFGAGFGFLLGSISMFASALLTGGVGPWLPFQMMAAAWVGLGAGLLPKALGGKAEIAMLAAYGVVAAYAFGAVMNLWFWPFATGNGTGISYVPGAAITTNLHRFALFDAATSLGWDAGRAITNVVAIVLVGTAVLATLRRAARKAAFEAPVTFDPPSVPAGMAGVAAEGTLSS